MTPREIKRTTIPTPPAMFVTTAIIPATSLVSAQIKPMIVPTTSKATIADNQYRIRRLVMLLSVLPSGRFANRIANPSARVAEKGGRAWVSSLVRHSRHSARTRKLRAAVESALETDDRYGVVPVLQIRDTKSGWPAD